MRFADKIPGMMPEARREPVEEKEAARIAREFYGLDAELIALPGEYDDNFRLTEPGGRSFVLKVMHPARERSFLDLQCRALRHLEATAPHLPVPRIRGTRDAYDFAQVTLANGSARFVWLLDHLPGTLLADARPHSTDLLRALGHLLGELDAALLLFAHPAAERELKWDLARAGWIGGALHCVADPGRRVLAERFLRLYENTVAPLLPHLRRSVIYGDANDYNVLVGNAHERPRRITGLFDFGDMHRSVTVAEAAVAAAYAILGKKDVLDAALAVVGGYHAAFPLEENELAALCGLIGMRLAVSVVNSAQRKALVPGDPYVTISEEPAWEALERLAQIRPRFAQYAFRDACGLPAVTKAASVARGLREITAAPILDRPLRELPHVILDLSVGSPWLGADPASAETSRLTEAIFSERKRAGAAVAVGRYAEPRLLYSSPLFGASANPTDERRTIHLGIDLFVEAGTPLHAPLAGTVHALANNRAALDYGPVVILRHAQAEGLEFFTLYGHLSSDTLKGLKEGQPIAAGQAFAHVGEAGENGGWPPHVHFQIILNLLGMGADFPGVAPASRQAVWKSLSPDPSALLGISAGSSYQERTGEDLLAARKKLLGPSLSVSYEKPLHIVRGWKQYLYDETGRACLDVYNNVPLVGHSHPRVVRAVQQQIALLNTNTRYLHQDVLLYADRLTRLLPEPLRVCYFVNSGSEANELALRLARAHTGHDNVIVLEHAYHGNSTTLIDVSPYKFGGPGGAGRKPWVHVAPLPDDYRGAYRRGDPDAGPKYARHFAEILDRLRAEGRGLAAFLAETLPSVAGQIVFPPNYLREAYRHVRSGGGVCIADEVQTGFGRLGTHFWGFQSQNVVPDVVVLGKPIGNAFPVAAVVTTPEIAASFANGMEFFSTYGGNPVACAAGLAVLDVLAEENLQQNAERVGHRLLSGLRLLREKRVLIGDVRGSGLFLGVELVLDRATRDPAPRQAAYIVNRLRECGILTGTDGPHHNVLKLRPPLVFSEADAGLFLTTLAAILEEDPAQPALE